MLGHGLKQQEIGVFLQSLFMNDAKVEDLNYDKWGRLTGEHTISLHVSEATVQQLFTELNPKQFLISNGNCFNNSAFMYTPFFLVTLTFCPSFYLKSFSLIKHAQQGLSSSLSLLLPLSSPSLCGVCSGGACSYVHIHVSDRGHARLSFFLRNHQTCFCKKFSYLTGVH